jgi:hypothetical protein
MHPVPEMLRYICNTETLSNSGKTTAKLSQYSRFQEQVLNPRSTKYQAAALTNQPRRTKPTVPV